MRQWLIKFAPFRTSWSEIIRTGTFTLRGVRSPEACCHLTGMKAGDLVLFYQSQQEKNVIGVLEVIREAYPDPTSNDPRWLTCDFTPARTFARPVTLGEIKASGNFHDFPLVRQPRLAVMPVSRAHYSAILALASISSPPFAPHSCQIELKTKS